MRKLVLREIGKPSKGKDYYLVEIVWVSAAGNEVSKGIMPLDKDEDGDFHVEIRSKRGEVQSIAIDADGVRRLRIRT